MGNLSKILLLTLIGAVPPTPATAKLPPSSKSCDEITDHVLRDLHQLKMDNEQVKRECETSAGIPANDDHGNRWGKGDCQLTYNSVRYYIRGIEKELKRSCQHVQEARKLSEACTASGQADCQTKTGGKFAEAGTALRSALNLMKRAKENLQERMIWNAETAQQYADYLMRLADALQNNQPLPDPSAIYGQMTPEQVIAKAGLTHDPNRIRHVASSITNTFKTIGSDVTGLDRFSREQAKAFRHGETFLKESRELEGKMQRFSAYLNKNAGTQIDRGQQLGAGQNSSITGGAAEQLSGAKQMAAAASQGLGSPGAGAGAGYPSAVQAGAGRISAQSQPLEPDFGDDELHSTLEGKPLSAKELERREAYAEAAVLAEDAKNGQGAAPGLFGLGGVGGAVASGSDSLAPPDSAADNTRGIASLPASAGGAAGSQNLTGASSPGAAGARRKGGEEKESNEALANYAASSGGAKLLDRGGPSLRDMLRQKMQGGGASTRAMHEVLGGIKELNSNEGDLHGVSEGARSFAEQGSNEDIKGIDSEPLFVRVRAAHLRYQRVHVGDTSI